MSSTQEFILFIPGFGSKEPETYLIKLVEGIRKYCDRNNFSFEDLDDSAIEIEGIQQRRIKVQLDDEISRVIDIQEVYWGDLKTILSPESGIIQVIRGLNLLLFWILSPRLWKQIISSKYIFFWTLATLIVSIAWYYGVLATTFTAIGADPHILGLELTDFELVDDVVSFFQERGDYLNGINAMVISSILIYVFPVKEIIDMAYATKCYLTNYKGTYNKIYSRVNTYLRGIVKQSSDEQSNKPKYDRITVLSHSFGVVISTELLAKYSGKIAIRNITLGGALLLITGRSNRVKKAQNLLATSSKIAPWIDFYSESDWLCTTSSINKQQEIDSRRIKTVVEFDEKFTGESHNLYFDDDEVIQTLLT